MGRKRLVLAVILAPFAASGCYTTFDTSLDAGGGNVWIIDAPAPSVDVPREAGVTDRPRVDAPAADVPTDRPATDAGPPVMIARARVGPQGGVVQGGGVSLGVPAGALPAMTELTVTVDMAASTGRAMPHTPVYRFGPAGTRFTQPVLINIAVPAGAIGRLYWTRPGDERTFEPVGFAENGRARAWITHFSAGYVAGDGCPMTVSVQQCACRATDRNDALCVNAPPDDCLAANGWTGFAGGMCSGYGLRDEFISQCGCTGPMGQTLCSTPHELPSQRCLDGTRSFSGENGGSCYGYYMSRDANGTPYSQGTSGTLTACAQVPRGTVWRIVQGRLADCMARPPSYTDWMAPPGVAPMTPLQAPPMTPSFTCE